MTTKIVIIDVDLGLSVDDIINKEVEHLTGAAAKELDNALEIAKATQKVKQEKEESAKAADNKLSEIMEKAYNDLVNAKDTGLAVSTIMSAVDGIIPNTSAFTTRMKGLLAKKGYPYILERQKVHGTPHYVLTPFNQSQNPQNG